MSHAFGVKKKSGEEALSTRLAGVHRSHARIWASAESARTSPGAMSLQLPISDRGGWGKAAIHTLPLLAARPANMHPQCFNTSVITCQVHVGHRRTSRSPAATNSAGVRAPVVVN
eukprot:6195237-Pleurochrysis_carterae.AAC.2